MTGLDRLNKEIYYTYHSKKNKEMLPVALFFGVICIIFKHTWAWEMIVWSIYFWYCQKNNAELNNSKSNLEKRSFLLKFRQDILSGKAKFEDD